MQNLSWTDTSKITPFMITVESLSPILPDRKA